MTYMIRPLTRYFDFRGRSRRREFWLWYLFVIIMIIVLSIIDTTLGLGGSGQFGAVPNGAAGSNYVARTNGGILTGIFTLGVLIPNFSVSVRRLHDTNRSGWWMLLPVLPYVIGAGLLLGGAAGLGNGLGGLIWVSGLFMLIGVICALVVLVFYFLEGTRGPNRFGPDPKGSGETLDEVFR